MLAPESRFPLLVANRNYRYKPDRPSPQAPIQFQLILRWHRLPACVLFRPSPAQLRERVRVRVLLPPWPFGGQCPDSPGCTEMPARFISATNLSRSISCTAAASVALSSS